MATLSGEQLVVITGPTGSGKTALAIELAEKFGGEIVCADSRTVYEGMDIGTAKPTLEEQARVRHHLLDVVKPDERFTVYDFQRMARQAIVEIRTRGHIPFLVGGTGMYIDSVILDYEFGDEDQEKRQSLTVKTIEELQKMIKNQHLNMPYNAKNKRHLVQVLSNSLKSSSAKKEPTASTYVVAISTEKAILEQRIEERACTMFRSNVLQEATRLGKKYGWDTEAMTGNIYPILRQVLDGEISIEKAIDLFVIRDRQLAKRQVTWLKRHSFVQWMSLDKARVYLEDVLSR